MKCRKVVKDLDHDKYNIVYFGSIGLQDPYAILFKINNNPSNYNIISNIKVQNDIVTNADNYELKIDDNITIYITVNLSDKDNPMLEYSNISDPIEINAYYYTEEMYDSYLNGELHKDSAITKSYTLDPAESSIKIDILQMSKKWNTDKSSYALHQEGVASSLIQRLSVLQGELWYDITYGLPLLSKIKDKFIYDSIIINIILKHPDVREIISFKSNINVKSIDHGTYSFECVIMSTYNEAITISSSHLI